MFTNSKRIALFSVVAASLGLAQVSKAAIYTVNNTNFTGAGSLAQALSQAQGDTNATINIASGLGTITLKDALPAIQNNLVINGNGNTINGAGTNRIFFVNAPSNTVQINGLTLFGGLAQGGNGGLGYGGGGGGAGLGGAIFLNAGNLTISGVSFSNNAARGGAGSIGFDGGTGGFGGGGGGGGLAFSGGAGGQASADQGETYEGPGGGGALTSGGVAGDPNSARAGAGGGVNGGQGGTLSLGGNAGAGASPTLPDGGGGGGGLTVAGGNGGNGGNGSDFGGGGGAGSSDTAVSGLGGNGGFGGGGGGGANSFADGYAGGNGGFGGGGGGGGGGGDANGAGSTGGFGGGNGANGNTGNAGGGLGAGGAIFARLGSTLTLLDCTFNGDTVAAGSAGASPATAGLAIGQALFLGADVNYSVSMGTNTLAETIGGGNDANARGGFTKSGAGTLVVASAESYTGTTTVSGGTMKVVNNLLPSTAVNIASNAVLEYNYSYRVLGSSVTYTGSGTLRETGAGQVVFGPGVINVDFSPGALIDVQSGIFYGSSSYGGIWKSNQASINVAGGATFDAVEAGFAAAMQIDALTGAGTFQGGYFGNANGGLTTLTIGVAGGSGTFSGTLKNDASARLGIVKTGAGTETFSGANNTYSGGTTISNGTLVVNGTAGSGAVIVSGGTLAGVGTIAGPVSVGPAGTIAPGAPLGTLTISNTLTLAGNTLVALNSGANSKIVDLSNVTYGGTLIITNLGGPLSAGNTFTLFSAASSSGNFGDVAGSIGNGLAYSFNPANGVLTVVTTVAGPPTNIIYTAHSGALTVSWPSSYTGWVLQAQTNPPTMGLTGHWMDVPGSESVSSMTFTIVPTNSVFFRLRQPMQVF